MKNIPRSRPIANHHDAGFASSSKIEIEQRADEIAEIQDHSVVTGTDRALAREELNGHTLPLMIDEDASSMDSLSRDPSDPPAHHGHQTPLVEDRDEQNGLEELVSEGVEEAQHEQMLAARQRKFS